MKHDEAVFLANRTARRDVELREEMRQLGLTTPGTATRLLKRLARLEDAARAVVEKGPRHELLGDLRAVLEES